MPTCRERKPVLAEAPKVVIEALCDDIERYFRRHIRDKRISYQIWEGQEFFDFRIKY